MLYVEKHSRCSSIGGVGLALVNRRWELIEYLDNRWLSRPISFRPISPRPTQFGIRLVSELIDRDRGC